MDQLVNVIVAIDKLRTTGQRALDCEPGLGGLNQVIGPNISQISFHLALSIIYLTRRAIKAKITVR